MKRVICCLALAGLLSSTALAQKGGGSSEAMKHLANGYIQLSSEQWQAALDEFMWCYDKGAASDKMFEEYRNTKVIDGIAAVLAVYEKGIPVVEARRKLAAETVGNPPKVSPAFYDLLALNRVLGDEQANEELIKAAVSAGSIAKFGSKTITSKPGAVPGTITIKSIKDRAENAKTFTMVSPCTDVKKKLETLTMASKDEAKMASDQQAQLQKDIAGLQAQLDKASPEDQEHIIAKMREMVRIVRDDIAARQTQLTKEQAYYADLLKWCESQKETPTKG